jgi:acyl-coenzyme A thioesterase PaaI-like protein
VSVAPTLDCAALNAMIADSPANNWLGLQVLRIDADELTLRLPWRESLRAAKGAARTDDSALMFALNAACGYLIVALTGRGGAIVDLRCDCFAVAPAADLQIVARLLKRGRTLSSVEAELRDSGGQRCALARCTYFMAQAEHP